MPVIGEFEDDQWGVQVHEEIPVPAEETAQRRRQMVMQRCRGLRRARRESGLSAGLAHATRVFAPDSTPGGGMRVRRLGGSRR